MVRGRDQVLLKVTVAEVARNIIKQIGIDLSANLNYGTAVANFTNSNPFTAYGRNLVSGNALNTSFGSTPSVTATPRAMKRAGVVRTLAEPNLTAISGDSATFIAGGEFPVPARRAIRAIPPHASARRKSASRSSVSPSTLPRS